MTAGPDPFESAVVGIIRILAPWPPEQRAKILRGADYCMFCGSKLSKCGHVKFENQADFDAR